MKVAGREVRKHVVRRGESVILFVVGDHKFAIPATEVDEIRDLQGLRPTPLGSRMPVPKVRYVFQRKRRTYHVVDACQHFRMLPSKPTRMLILRRGDIALTADSIDRMAELSTTAPLPRAFQGAERHWYQSLALIDDSVVPVVNAGSVLTDSEAALTRDAVRKWRSEEEAAGA